MTVEVPALFGHLTLRMPKLPLFPSLYAIIPRLFSGLPSLALHDKD
jgi:hypothetical protein